MIRTKLQKNYIVMSLGSSFKMMGGMVEVLIA